MPVTSSPKNTRQRHLGPRLTHWAGLGSLVACCGGLLLLTYYTSIRFMPDLDLSSMRWVLVAVATLGVLIFAIFAAVMVLPAVLWLTMLSGSTTAVPAGSAPSQHVRTFTLQFLLPLWTAVILPLPIYTLFELTGKSYAVSILGLFGPLLLWLAVRTVCIFFERTEPGISRPETQAGQTRGRSQRLAQALQFSVVGLMAWVGWVAALVVISEELKSTSVHTNGQYIALTACIYLWIAFANLAIVSMAKKPADPVVAPRKLGSEVLVGSACCVAILVLLAPSFMPRVIMRSLGLGAIDNVTLLVDEQGKPILTEARRNHCGRPEDPPNALSSLTLLNVLGPRWLLECADKKETYRFTLAKDRILSWSTNTPRDQSHTGN